jgi:catechol 2,3-dioxygenase-like lactoylglutathione lyase family enzyme
MAIIKAAHIAHVRLSAPDLDVMEKFLLDFGMVRAARTENKLFMRGMGPRHHIHVTELGPAGFLGFAYGVRSAEELQTLSRETGNPVEAVDEPGGGQRVRLRDPNGFQIDVIHGQQDLAPLPNTIPQIRAPDGISQRRGAARVVRMGHGVIATPKLHETIAWFREMFGFIKTDELYIGDMDNLLGSFNRVDAGDDLVDHHVLFVVRNQNAGMHHASFEVANHNDIFIGHDHLVKTGYEHVRGVGRHALGSQIFDYWVSPYDQMHELWSSDERFNAASAANMVAIGPGMVHDHGPPPSEKFVKQATPYVGGA